MQRYRAFGPLDDTLEVFGDVEFLYLDMHSDPATLPAGAVQVSRNMRFDSASPTVRGATVRNGLSRQFTPGTNIGQILYCAIYKPVGGADQFAFVTATKLWLFDIPTQVVTAYPYPAGVVIGPADSVDGIQAGIGASSTLPQLFIPRGLANAVLVFDGTVVKTNGVIPQCEFGLAYQNRLAVNSGAQAVSTSNVLDFATWNLLNQFQIEQGGADYLVGMMIYQGDFVLIGTRKKWFIAFFDPTLGTSGYTGALQNASFLRILTNEAGPLGKEAMLETAGFVWFITDNGIFAFQPNLNNELVPLGKPLSADIQPVFSRISSKYASGAGIARFGYRLYFAMPISDVPIALTSVTVVNQTTNGVILPQTLPFLLTQGALATFVAASNHNLSPGDMVQLSNLTGGGLNGLWSVLSTTDSRTFLLAIPVNAGVALGAQAMMQKLAVRNNTIAVFNLNQRDANHPVGSWESIDSLPAGFYADWLRVADYGAQRALWVVDANNGPSLYETGSTDQVGTIQGGITVPFTLPVTLSAANYASVSIVGQLVSRSFRWEGTLGSPHGTIAYVRNVRASEARMVLGPLSAGTVTTRMRIPQGGGQALTGEWDVTVPFSAKTNPDGAVFKRLFNRALEVELEVNTTGGQPTVRALEVQVRKTGQY